MKTHLMRGIGSLLSFVAICVLAAVWLIPDVRSRATYRIDPMDIYVISTSTSYVARRPTIDDPDIRLPEQTQVITETGRQFTYKLSAPPKDGESLSLYIPDLRERADLHMNSIFDSSSTLYEPPRLATPRYKLIAEISPEKFHPGRNRIDILSRYSSTAPLFSDIYMGESQALKALDDTHSRRLTLLGYCLALGVMIGLCSALLLLVMRGKLANAISLCLLSGAVVIPMSPLTFEGLTLLRALLLSGGTIGLVLFVTSQWKSASHLGGFSIGAAIAFALGIVMSQILAGNAFFSHHSTLYVFGLICLLPLMLIVWPSLVFQQARSFQKTLKRAEAESLSKDERLREQERLLQREYDQKIVSEERQRFTRDIHDGIGGQLLSLLVRLRSGSIEMDGVQEEIKSGLTDLRLVVDSLDHVGHTLPSALGTFRQRVEAQCLAEDIHLDWTQSIHSTGLADDVRQILHIYRVLQECISNILRHARAQTITINIHEDAQSSRLIITCDDDGIGLDDTRNGAGKGLANIHERARKLGGEAVISNREGVQGVRTRLDIPMIRTA